MKKNVLLKMAAIIVICVLLDIVLHVATSAYSMSPGTAGKSALAQLLGTEAAATLWALLAFSGAAYVFYRFKNRLPGAGLTKGLRYGAAIALLWLFAMLEGVPLFGHPVLNEFVVGLSDAVPVLLMGALLGLFVVGNGGNTEAGPFTYNQKLLAIGIFAAVFVLGRYAAYFTGVVQSGWQTSPLHTFLWTLLMGVCIGIVFILLGPAAEASSIKRSALVFGFWIFGVNWAVFLVFMPLLFTGFLTDVLFRITIDILLVTLGYKLSQGWESCQSKDAKS